MKDFVWYKGKVWFNPRNPLTWAGQVSLWSIKNDGCGILADPSDVYDCTQDEIDAVRYFQQPPFHRKFPSEV